jgi:hypothetical protein
MGMIKALLGWLDFPRSRAGDVAQAEGPTPPGLGPLDLSPSQQEQVERMIDEFVGDSTSIHAHARGAVARAEALPLFFDLTAFMALRPDGHVVWVDTEDDPGAIDFVRETRLRNLGLYLGTKRYPELQFLLPSRPPDARECPHCRGTGRVILPQDLEHLSEKMNCFCGGIGWLPHDSKSSSRSRRRI